MRIEDMPQMSPEVKVVPPLSENGQRIKDLDYIRVLTEGSNLALSWDELKLVTLHYTELRDRATDPNRDETIKKLEADFEEQERNAQSAKFGEIAINRTSSSAMHRKMLKRLEELDWLNKLDWPEKFGELDEFDEYYRQMVNHAHADSVRANTELNGTFYELMLWKNAPKILERFVSDLSEGTVCVPGVTYLKHGKTLKESHTHPL